MKPVYLEFCGLNSFSEPAKIEFSKLLRGGVFGIFGDTGSGKSTILDAIHFALYGEVDRVPKSFNDCINHRLDGANVTFDFELTVEGERKRYRVKREKKRKNASGKAYLYEYTPEGGMLAIAEGTRDVNERIERVVGLTFEDFKTCIALPQGDFDALVKSTPAERVKLVARLFNLERYGERLTMLVNEKYKKADEASNLIKAKMGESLEHSEEEQKTLVSCCERDKEALSRAKTALLKAEENLKKAEEFHKAKQAHDVLVSRLEHLQTRFSEMEQKRKILEISPKAKRVIEQWRLLEKSKHDKEQAERKTSQAQALAVHLKAEAEKEKAFFKSQNYDEQLVAITVALEKHASLAQDVEDAQTAQRELESCQKQYKLLLNKCQAENFSEKKANLEEKLRLLGEDENLLDYLKRTYKGVLFRETYKEIRADLEGIKILFPQTEEEVMRLIKKYTLSETTENQVDIAQANLLFKQNEQQKKLLLAELETLEKRYREYEANEREKALLEKQGKLLRQRYELAKEKIVQLSALGSKESLEQQAEKLKRAKLAGEKNVEQTLKSANDSYAEFQRLSGLITALEEGVNVGKKTLETLLKEGGFTCVEEAERLLASIGEEERAKAETKAFFEEFTLLVTRVRETDDDQFSAYDETALALARENKRVTQEETEKLTTRLASEETELKNLEKLLQKRRALQKELEETEAYKNVCDQLKQLLRGNRFLEYVASEYLQEISISAGKTLLSLTGGRYFLKYENKEFKVGDNFDGGKARGVKTLSGGETFLVSLSLALSLSSAICMKSLRPIEFFFLDEGFGTLDGKLVDTVMDTLGKLGKNFSVGLISHVEELKRRIEQKILVTPATESRGSQVQTVTF